MDKGHDAIIIGAGPAGTVCALGLLQRGLRPLLVEKAHFPRYHVGESLSGGAAIVLRQLGVAPQLEAHGFPVKRGVKVYGKGGDNNFWVPVKELDEQGNWQDGTTWQVRREAFDHLLLETAKERGADVVQGEVIRPILQQDKVIGVEVRSADGTIQPLHAPVTVDASGQTTFFASKTNLTSGKMFGKYARQIAIFARLSNDSRDPADRADTLIFYREKHHWAWFIPVDEAIVSVGIVTPSDYYKGQRCSPEAFLRQELQTINPELARRISADALFVTPVRTASNYSYQVNRFTGAGFLCIGDSHRFIDPIFSFGVNFAVNEGLLAAQAIHQTRCGDAGAFAAYQTMSDLGQDVVQHLIDCFWEYPLPFLIITQYQYRDDITKIFSGHVYDDDIDQLAGVRAMRDLLNNKR